MLSGEFVVVAVRSREYQGKVYYNADIEIDNRVLNLGIDAKMYPSLLENKYKKMRGGFEVGVGSHGLYLRIVSAELALSK